ncbi:hypothetical protein B0A55_04354 [Friedmanniomyces simplex]|uniref:Peptidase A1 domain-containing protein n=1 Tax=Friedmanniomyces simplex TaxID=329884 RepID=A0A4U0XVA1_9PEZI|nr:hypothetical protein B0A55_04354 [Friedmanniomyces simplex]
MLTVAAAACFAGCVHGALKTTKTVSLPLTFDSATAYYLANVSVGSPPQDVSLSFDTGSSDIWIYTRKTKIHDGAPEGGSYDSAESAHSRLVSKDFEIHYGAVEVKGDFVADDFTVGGVAVKDTTFAQATKMVGPARHGIMGVGFDTNQAKYWETGGRRKPYNGLLDHMVEQGLIETHSFSMQLGKQGNGSVLFGGYDTSRFDGPMAVMPLLPDPEEPRQMSYIRALLSSVSLTDSNGASTRISPDLPRVTARFDSGNPSSQLPKAIMDNLAASLGAQYNPNTQHYVVPCDLNKTLDFGFGDRNAASTVSVKYADMTVYASDPDTGEPSVNEDGSPACELVFDEDSSGNAELGVMGFLQSTYLVHHLDEKMLGIAQASDDYSRPADIVELKPGDKAWRRAGGRLERLRGPRPMGVWFGPGGLRPYGTPRARFGSRHLRLARAALGLL